jgi:hypothetical protein
VHGFQCEPDIGSFSSLFTTAVVECEGMATTYDSPTSSTLNGSNGRSVHHLSRSLERALDEATYTGELILTGRKLREFPNYSCATNKCDLSDTVTAGLSARFDHVQKITSVSTHRSFPQWFR